MVSIVGSPITPSDIRRALKYAGSGSFREEFCAVLAKFAEAQYVYAVNSGISSFYIILEALRGLSPKKEVILPAYTAGSLVVAVRKAGLVPVLCDISLEDFNLDVDSLQGVISEKTLAIVGVHSFGISIKDIKGARRKIPDNIFFIEDCAQSMGSKVKEKETGVFGDVSFFSFNRGKNLPLCGGGCIATNNGKIAAGIEEKIKNLGEQGLFSNISSLLAVTSFSLAVKPFVYGAGFGLISRFKDNAPPQDFKIAEMNGFQAKLGLLLMRKKEELFLRRYENGMRLIRGLLGVNGIILPKIQEYTRPAFNRLPIVFKYPGKRTAAQKRLWECGIEASPMYSKPLHSMFSLGYKKEDFPNANYLAERLLTLPAHPAVEQEALSKIVETIRQI